MTRPTVSKNSVNITENSAYEGILCAVLGVGSQFLALASGILILALIGVFKPGHGGAIHTYSIIYSHSVTCIQY